MRTRLYPMSDRMCLLALRDVTDMDMDDVDAWFEAIDMSSEELDILSCLKARDS